MRKNSLKRPPAPKAQTNVNARLPPPASPPPPTPVTPKEPEVEDLFQRALAECPELIKPKNNLRLAFEELYCNLGEITPLEAIWRAFGHTLDEEFHTITDGRNVRTQLSHLRDALRRHFPNVRRGPRFILPDVIPNAGAVLRYEQRPGSQRVTSAFWQPHVDCQKTIFVVYVAQLFFETSEGMVFRYFDCNAEHHNDAIAELQKRHPELPEIYLNARPIYPFAAWGESEAKELITHWFSEYAITEVKSSLSRKVNVRDDIQKQSLILFGSSPSNRFITNALAPFDNIPMRLEGRDRIVIRGGFKQNEEQRLSQFAEEIGGLDFGVDGGKGSITFKRTREHHYVPIILTRLMTRKDNIPITILNTTYGGAVLELADALTKNKRLADGFATLNVELPLPECFQCACGVQLYSEREALSLHPFVWREYKPSGV